MLLLELSRELVGSLLSNTEFSDFSFEDGCEEGVGMLMWLMKVYVGAFIILMHDGGGRGVGVRGRLIYRGGAALLTVRRGIEASFGVEHDDELDDELDEELDGGYVGVTRGVEDG